MWSKADFYSAVAKETLEGLTASWQEWAKFLTTASRLYKYPFMDQMMIYAQRPDATACAEYDLWNDKMNRYVRRGSKGIALLDERGDKLRLRYVFDVADTGTRENSRTPWLWTMEDQHIVPIMAMLERNYGVGGVDLGEQIAAAARTLADEYWADNQKDFFYIVDDSFLEGYDNYNIGIQFKTAATASITYTVLSRCGLNPAEYMGHEDFMPIFDFNTIPAVMALGSAVSQSCRSETPFGLRSGKPLRKGENGMKNTLTYTRNGDYLIPNLKLDEQPEKPLGKYGRMRRAYLKENRPLLYNQFLLNGTLYPHLLEIEETANQRLELIMNQLLEKDPAPDKKQSAMAWVQHMNALKAQAEEVILTELINS